MRRSLLVAGVALGALAPSAQAESVLVSMGNTAFLPGQVDILVGDTVAWRNASTKTHNVRFGDGSFDSGRIAPREAANTSFAAPGTFAYVCTIHDGMDGEVSVHPLLISGPRGAVRRGASVALHLRVPENPGTVTIEEDSGGGWVPVATAGPPPSGHEGHAGPGTLHAAVVPPGSASYRAVSAAGVSPELRVQVSDGTQLAVAAKRVRRGGSRVDVRAAPAEPRARIVLQLKLRERFGWWPVARGRLNRRSRATFRVRGRAGAPARAVLVGGDWVTPLATSPVVRLPR